MEDVQQARYRACDDPHAPALHSPFRRISGRRHSLSMHHAAPAKAA